MASQGQRKLKILLAFSCNGKNIIIGIHTDDFVLYNNNIMITLKLVSNSVIIVIVIKKLWR